MHTHRDSGKKAGWRAAAACTGTLGTAVSRQQPGEPWRRFCPSRLQGPTPRFQTLTSWTVRGYLFKSFFGHLFYKISLTDFLEHLKQSFNLLISISYYIWGIKWLIYSMNMCETPAPESGVLVFFIFPFVLNFILWSPLLELTLVHMYIISFFFCCGVYWRRTYWVWKPLQPFLSYFYNSRNTMNKIPLQ